MIAGGDTVYQGVDLPLPFTGSMIICDGFIQDLDSTSVLQKA